MGIIENKQKIKLMNMELNIMRLETELMELDEKKEKLIENINVQKKLFEKAKNDEVKE